MEPERSLEQRVAAVEGLLRTILTRLEEIELRSPGAHAVAQPAPAAPAPSPSPSQQPPARPVMPPQPAAAPTAPPPTASSPRKVRRPGETLEDLLGGRILAAVGGLAILIGVVLFLVIAVDRGWIGVEARIALAFAGSTLLLAVGLFLYERRGQTDAAVAAVAAALASLYASLTYATAVKDVLATQPGLLVAGVIGAAGAAIAVRWQSQFVAALGILGALAAPVLVDSGASTLALGFTVIALVAAVAVLLWQRWGWLSIGAFLLTAPQVALWAEDRADLALPLSMLALYWCLFVVAGIGYELRVPTSELRSSSASVLLVNAGFASAAGGT